MTTIVMPHNFLCLLTTNYNRNFAFFGIPTDLNHSHEKKYTVFLLNEAMD
jgi:hypothetical protein